MSMNLTIIHNANHEVLDSQRIPNTYAHGKLESDIGYDIISLTNFKDMCEEWNEDKIYPKEGIFPCLYKEKKCLFFIWEYKYEGYKGLCVYVDDIGSLEFAFNHYINRSNIL